MQDGRRPWPQAIPKTIPFRVIRTWESDNPTSPAPGQPGAVKVYTESLILAQNERWRQASYMQVERASLFGEALAANG